MIIMYAYRKIGTPVTVSLVRVGTNYKISWFDENLSCETWWKYLDCNNIESAKHEFIKMCNQNPALSNPVLL